MLETRGGLVQRWGGAELAGLAWAFAGGTGFGLPFPFTERPAVVFTA